MTRGEGRGSLTRGVPTSGERRPSPPAERGGPWSEAFPQAPLDDRAAFGSGLVEGATGLIGRPAGDSCASPAGKDSRPVVAPGGPRHARRAVVTGTRRSSMRTGTAPAPAPALPGAPSPA